MTLLMLQIQGYLQTKRPCCQLSSRRYPYHEAQRRALAAGAAGRLQAIVGLFIGSTFVIVVPTASFGASLFARGDQ